MATWYSLRCCSGTLLKLTKTPKNKYSKARPFIVYKNTIWVKHKVLIYQEKRSLYIALRTVLDPQGSLDPMDPNFLVSGSPGSVTWPPCNLVTCHWVLCDMASSMPEPQAAMVVRNKYIVFNKPFFIISEKIRQI